ncbi:MAG: ACP S-malonyltransferase, partial [Rickettsiales bacterium]|nr:ACP S-malonyltransferase [Rickettsiales bacterium]
TIETVEKLLLDIKKTENGIIQVANDNTNGQVVISGDMKLIDIATDRAVSFGFKKAVKLDVSGAFHSVLMQTAVETMRTAISNVKMEKPKVKFISNVSADFADDLDVIKNNLILQVTNSVKWRETMLLLSKNGVNKIVEVGPNKVLSPMVSRTLENTEAENIDSIETINEYKTKL